MHNNKQRRPNNMNGGNMNAGNGGGQHRHNGHNNNRPRRFNNGRSSGAEGGGDAASISRTRRNATQSREKYQMMARDAQSSGDRVLAEYYLQHADHYHRVLLALPPEEAPRPQYQRNYHQNGEPQPADPQLNTPHAPMNGAGDMPSAPAETGLPSFITQPSVPDEVREN